MRAQAPSTGAKLLLLTVLSAAGILASSTAATVYVAGAPQRPSPTAERGNLSVPAGQRTAHFDGARSGVALGALVDSLLEPLGALPEADTATMSQMVAILANDRTGAGTAWRPHGTPLAGDDARLAVYRRWARSRQMPAFWAYARSFPGVRTSLTMPVFNISELRALAEKNEAAADSALVHGELETAYEHARENIAAARHLVWQPFPIDALMGRSLLTNAAKLLARTALQGDQPTVHSQAQRLLSLTSDALIAPKPTWSVFSRYGASPNDDRLMALVGDSSLFPATRMLAMESMVNGACLNTREVLFGVLPSRRAAIDSMLSLIHDVPRVAELRSALHGTLNEFDAASFTDGSTRRNEWSIGDWLLELLVPDNVYARSRACRR